MLDNNTKSENNKIDSSVEKTKNFVPKSYIKKDDNFNSSNLNKDQLNKSNYIRTNRPKTEAERAPRAFNNNKNQDASVNNFHNKDRSFAGSANSAFKKPFRSSQNPSSENNKEGVANSEFGFKRSSFNNNKFDSKNQDNFFKNKSDLSKKTFIKKPIVTINEIKKNEKTKVKADTAIHGFYGTGRRKNSIAKVRIYPTDNNSGQFFINEKTIKEYFTRISYQTKILKVLELVNGYGKFNIKCHTLGGGLTGQVGAIILGLSRALCEYNKDNRIILKANKLLTRDSRMVLSKKIDHVKSRKRRAFVKR